MMPKFIVALDLFIGGALSLDDFATGYSFLAYLKYLPIETLKIDRWFVNDIGKDHDDETIIKALLSLAQNIGIQTVAEGVETPEQADYLVGLGCDYLQGYFLSKPIEQDAFLALLH